MNYLLLLFPCLFISCGSAQTPGSPDSSRDSVKLKQGGSLTLHEVKDIPLPSGYIRKAKLAHSFASYLETLPIRQGDNQVHLYDGTLKVNQKAQYRILDIDVGRKDLQQCADAVMRLRAEYLFRERKFADIHFKFTSGDDVAYEKWRNGWRPFILGNQVSWEKKSKTDTSYSCFRDYLNTVFTYAGSLSLSRELKKRDAWKDICPGDVIIHGGTPGHAVIVLDVAEDEKGGKVYLIAQSYMPAQDIHILKNPSNGDLNPWYSTSSADEQIRTPEWEFSKGELMHFD